MNTLVVTTRAVQQDTRKDAIARAAAALNNAKNCTLLQDVHMFSTRYKGVYRFRGRHTHLPQRGIVTSVSTVPLESDSTEVE